MCGVAGLVCFEGDRCRSDHESMVASLCAIQTHRGPNDEGVVSLGDVCLGSRRLSILDLSAAGHMPMSDESRRWWIVYNGEVYNFRELRSDLESRGHRFLSGSDTEVILHAFTEWGDAAFDRFAGMFAVALLDRQTRTVTLVRDRFGIKPLYYTRAAGHFVFSSEVKALVEFRGRVRVDQQQLFEWFLYRNIDAITPETLLEDISSVLPGQVLKIRGDSIASTFFYRPQAHVEAAALEAFERMRGREIVGRIEETLREAVRCRLVSDVPVGTLCSGGLDSSLVTAMAAEHTTDITAFNVSVEDAPDLDEKRFAQALTRSLGIDLVSHPLTADSFRRTLPRAVYHADFPLTHPNSVAYLQISEVARAHGVIVLLSGEGADELFGGYGWRYRRLRTLARLDRLLGLLPGKMLDRLLLVAYAAAGLPATAHRLRELLPEAVAASDRFARTGWVEECSQAYAFIKNAGDRSILANMLADLNDFLAPLLRRLDRLTMAASVECRVPFLDHRLVHQAINLPLAYRVGARSDKWLLKQVARAYLPRRNVWRRKLGFPIPLASYLGPLADYRYFRAGFCEGHLRFGETGLRNAIGRWDRRPLAFFGILTLEMWGRMFVLGQELQEVEELFAGSPTRAIAVAS